MPLGRKPSWLKVRVPAGENAGHLRRLTVNLGLHTVCESARCPNQGECWQEHTATFLLLGNRCTRHCGFCAVEKGTPEPIDADEPRRVAEAVAALGLDYAVLTSVTRDDDLMGGARSFAACVEAIRRLRPGCRVELLIPDFQGDREAIRTVVEARPAVLNHNLETVARLYAKVRAGADYRRSLDLFRTVAEFDPEMRKKSGIMVGLGEERAELRELFADLAAAGCESLTIGQYLRPSREQLEVVRYYSPEKFAELACEARACGIGHVESGPLVRSSYHAQRQAAEAEGERG